MTQQTFDAKAAEPKGLRILHMHAENVKRIVLVDWEPGRHANVIAGDNGQGKTSLLDCIPYLFGGEKALPQEPLRRGAESGHIWAVLGENGKPLFRVERKFTKRGSYLKVTSADGLAYPTPQSMLDSFWSAVSFDPGAWLRKPAREQREELLRIAELKLDIPANRAAQKAAYEERRDLGRDLKTAEGALAELGAKPAVPEARAHGIVLAEYERARMENGQNETDRQYVRGAEESIARMRGELAEFKRRAEAEMQHRADAIGQKEERLALDRARVSALADRDLPALSAELSKAQEAAATRERIAQHERIAGRRDELTGKTTALSKRIAELDAELVAAVKSADFPVPGLGFGDDGVLFNDLPLDQASHAEQLRVALAVAMRVQQRRGRHLRLVRMSEADRFDAKSLALVNAEAEANDFQILMERVSKEGASIVIEDGAVAAPAEAKP